MSVELAEIDVEAQPETIDVTPLALTVGAEITGVDLTRPLPDRQVREVWGALLKWKAIFFSSATMRSTWRSAAGSAR